MIVFISAAATERLMVARATKSLPAAFPLIQILDSGKLQTDAQIDGLLASAGAETCVFVARVLGGKNYFERGVIRLQEFCRERKRYLIALPGDQNPDVELDAISNVRLADAATAFQYALAGGVENYRNLLLYLADVFLSTAFGFDATAQVIDDWMYQQVAEKYVLDETSREFCERSNPWALREMTGRLLEAAERGMWGDPDPETLAQLKAAYLANEGFLEEKGEGK